MATPAQELAEVSKDWVLHFPDGKTFPSGQGLNAVSLNTGSVRLYNKTEERLNYSLKSLKREYLENVAFWADTNARVILYYKGRQTKGIFYEQCSDLVLHVPVIALDISFAQPGNMYLLASTEELTSISRPASAQLRYATGTTTDTMAAVQWQALNAAGDLSDSSALYTAPNIYTGSINQKTLCIFNTDAANSMNVNLQGQGDIASANWVDHPSTGASTTITAGNNLLVDPTTPFAFMRLRVKSTVAGSGAKYEVHYIGSAQ